MHSDLPTNGEDSTLLENDLPLLAIVRALIHPIYHEQWEIIIERCGIFNTHYFDKIRICVVDSNRTEIFSLCDEQSEGSIEKQPTNFFIEQSEKTYCEIATLQVDCQGLEIRLHLQRLLIVERAKENIFEKRVVPVSRRTRFQNFSQTDRSDPYIFANGSYFA